MVDGRAAADLVATLWRAVGLTGSGPKRADAVALLDAEVRGDRSAIVGLAERGGWDVEATATVARSALIPFLSAAREALQAQRSPSGDQLVTRHSSLVTACCVCGAWPLLAEVRGLDRSRWPRCGRCGAGWPVSWLRCVYCGEQDHQRLRSLVPEEGGDRRRVETCETCRGYLKSVQTLQALPLFEVLLVDLETVELDLAAQARGFARPDATGYALRLRVVAQEAR